MRSLAALILLAACALAAQAPAPTQFDAAVVKPVAVSGSRRGGGFQIDPLHLNAEGLTLKSLLMDAYSLKSWQVEGPAWISSARFDITAVTAAPVSRAAMLVLLRSLLAHRFRLSTHRISRAVSGYVLEAAAGGSQLRPSRAGDTNLDPGQFRMSMTTRPPVLTLTGYVSADELAQNLSGQLGMPVANHTALTGDYVIKMTYAMPPGLGARILTPRGRAAVATANGGTNGTAPAPAPSLFAALQHQLGLRLVATKVVIPVLEVDSALRNPTTN
ncbi:MAG: TIGR03435 family protein [Terriglobales bacterium]